MNISLHVLIVDDESNIRRTLSLSLKDLGCVVETAASVDEAMKKLQTRDIDLVLTDFKMAGKTGLDLVREARALNPNLTVVVMSAYASIENAVAVVKEGAFDYLPKPFTTPQLRQILNRVRELAIVRRENADLKKAQRHGDYFAGYTSEAAKSLAGLVRRVAPTDALVLLVGESGTGKSGLARLMHSISKRATQPFITVYCTTLVESLLDSELFGHVKGAFAGALQDKIGKLELADGGTLFLDEIGDLTPTGQGKLLRVLQEQVFERIGSDKTITVDTRIIAATNKDLAEAVAAGTFREDLYYRLNMLECILAPLRHRKEDLPVMIERTLKALALEKKWPVRTALPESVSQLLLAYDWPGNMRELHNVLERLLMLSEGREIKSADLPDSIRKPKEAAVASPAGALPVCSIETMEKELITRVLAQEKNQERAAELLGITKVTLWRKRKQYGLP